MVTTDLSVPSVRARLNAWIVANRWSSHQINLAMHRLHMNSVLPHYRIEQFARGDFVPEMLALRCLDRFMRDHPEPGTMQQFRQFLDDAARQAVAHREDHLLRRRLEREEKRAAHVRDLLAQEHRPKPRRPQSPLHGLDKATIAALSGGTYL
jgi:hypothetical protein